MVLLVAVIIAILAGSKSLLKHIVSLNSFKLFIFEDAKCNI